MAGTLDIAALSPKSVALIMTCSNPTREYQIQSIQEMRYEINQEAY